jgi:anti-sigma factor RsiW
MNGTQGQHSHISPAVMQGYVLGQLSETEREQAEAHLLSCDECLHLFMNTEPMLAPHIQHPNLPGLERQVINKLHAADRRRGRPSLRWLQRSSVQYTIAASITLVLYFSGTFANIATKLAELEMNATIEHQDRILQSPSLPADSQQASWSEQMVSRTGSWLDSLKASRFDQDK